MLYKHDLLVENTSTLVMDHIIAIGLSLVIDSQPFLTLTWCATLCAAPWLFGPFFCWNDAVCASLQAYLTFSVNRGVPLPLFAVYQS
jgi:hypothetical protein